jgi:exodeoxyribonuclease VII large subunit
VGVVTSLGAAALQDVLTTLRRRAPHVRVVVYPSLVQGLEAPAALVEALRQAGQRREVETVLLVRGGGAIEDLWAFNDERVVQAVASCPLPVICGVGHETDLTLCDLAADLRAPTPTAAAELAAPSRDEAMEALRARQAALQARFERSLQAKAQRLDTLALRLGRPAQALALQSQRLQALEHRLHLAGLQRRLRLGQGLPALAERLRRAWVVQRDQLHLRLASAGQRLQAHDPHRVLQRGYAWVEAEDGRPVVSARVLRPGQTVRAVWADGRARAEVLAVESLPPEP